MRSCRLEELPHYHSELEDTTSYIPRRSAPKSYPASWPREQRDGAGDADAPAARARHRMAPAFSFARRARLCVPEAEGGWFLARLAEVLHSPEDEPGPLRPEARGQHGPRQARCARAPRAQMEGYSHLGARLEEIPANLPRPHPQGVGLRGLTFLVTSTHRGGHDLGSGTLAR